MIGTVAVLNTGSVHGDLAEWLRGLPSTVALLRPAGREVAAMRNASVRGMRGDWLLFVDSDCVPEPDALSRLLETEQALVGGVVLSREAQQQVCAVRTFQPYARWRLDELPREGLLRTAALGTGFLLARRQVFQSVEPPWFRCGQLHPEVLAEDTDFCLRASAVGIAPYLACHVRVGHAMSAVLWPHADGSPWVQWEGAAVREPLDRWAGESAPR